MLERAKACGPIVFAAMREDIIEVAVELGLNSGDPQAIAVARELAEAGADADSPPIDDAREGSLSDQRCRLGLSRSGNWIARSQLFLLSSRAA